MRYSIPVLWCILICVTAFLLKGCRDGNDERREGKGDEYYQGRSLATLSSYGLYAQPWKTNNPPHDGLFVTSKFWGGEGIICLQRSSRIEASALTMFGVEFQIHILYEVEDFNAAEDSHGLITLRVNPPHSIQANKTDHNPMFEKKLDYSEAENVFGFYWGIGLGESQIRGEWTFQILHGKRIILEKAFDVSFSPSPPIGHYDYSRNRGLGKDSTRLALVKYGIWEMLPEWSDKGFFFPYTIREFPRIQLTDLIDVRESTCIGLSCSWIGMLTNKQECFIFNLIPPTEHKINEKTQKDFTFSRTLEDIQNDGCACGFNVGKIRGISYISGKWTIQITTVDGVVLAEKQFFLKGK